MKAVRKESCVLRHYAPFDPIVTYPTPQFIHCQQERRIDFPLAVAPTLGACLAFRQWAEHVIH
jgi:hypothetical protein